MQGETLRNTYSRLLSTKKKGAVKKQSKKSEVHDNPWVSDNFFIKNRYLRRNFKIVLFLGYKEQTDRFCRLKVWITF